MARLDLLVVGGGRMGEALLAGILRGGANPDAIAVVEPDASRGAEIAARYGIAVVTAPIESAGVVVAVKPQHVSGVATEIAPLGPDRVLSIAAGVTLDALDKALPGVAVIRAMPNTPALVGEGAAAIAPGASASEADLDWAERLLSSVGKVVRLPEDSLDAVTGLSGSGPAYLFLVAEALIEAGVAQGLDRDVAVALTNQTLLGASTLLVAGERSAAELRDDVTSPGGTTAEGLRALEEHGVRAGILDAVRRATDRSRELGSGKG